MQVLGAAAVKKLHVFKAQELSNLLLAYAKTEHYDWVVLTAIDEAQAKLSYLDASCQVRLGETGAAEAAAFASLGLGSDTLRIGASR